MNTRIKHLILMVTIFSIVLCGCVSEPEAKDVYEDYLAMAEVSLSAAINKYCHYERIEIYHMVWDTPEYMTSHEIVSWEQLSDNLWAARLRYTSDEHRELVSEGTNFVGLIQGTYKVFISIEEVPFFLTEGLDLTKYYNERIDPEDGSVMYL